MNNQFISTSDRDFTLAYFASVLGPAGAWSEKGGAIFYGITLNDECELVAEVHTNGTQCAVEIENV